jgi:hypothetical protein
MNRAWYRDNQGAIVNVVKDSKALDISIDYNSWLNTTEYLTDATFTTPSDINYLGDFTSRGRVGADVGKMRYAVLYADFNVNGTYTCSVQATTNEGRVYSNKFKIKVI